MEAEIKKKVEQGKKRILDSRKKRKLFYGEREKDKKERVNQLVIQKKKDNETFSKNKSSRLAHIKKHTLYLVQLDKFDIRDKVEALRAFAKAQQIQGKDKDLFLSITLSKQLPKITFKPIPIDLPCGLKRGGVTQVCGLVVDNNEMKEAEGLKEQGVELVPMDRFCKWVREQKQALVVLRKWDYFFCSESVYDRLRHQGHKLFTKKKKLPYPVALRDLPVRLKELTSKLYFCKSAGPVFKSRVANLEMDNKEIVKNVMNAVYNIIPHILVDSEKNTQVLHIAISCEGSKLLEIYKNDHKFPEQSA